MDTMIADVLHGKAAVELAERTLTKTQVDARTWEVNYVNPTTGDRWIMDYPDSEAHGGGSPRLQRVLASQRLQP